MPNRAFTFTAIGEVQSCFKEKFGIPRQPGLAPSAWARILIYPEFAREEAFAGIEGCSHLWLQFVFHANDATWRPKVRPPRLGGNKTLGVFATRSPNRPNPIGLSVVTFLGLTKDDAGFFVEIGGVDFLDGTPILDIKPYVPYADAIFDARNTVAPEAPQLLPVLFSSEAAQFCVGENKRHADKAPLENLIREVLQQDPRPQYQAVDSGRIYGMRLWNLNVRWCYRENAEMTGTEIYVMTIAPVAD
jgi:tRNA-Thr(GGU) m(6)t(6)A37 methyltransferase TsaA